MPYLAVLQSDESRARRNQAAGRGRERRQKPASSYVVVRFKQEVFRKTLEKGANTVANSCNSLICCKIFSSYI